MPDNLIKSIRDQLATDFHLDEMDGRIRIATPLQYDDGDSCTFFLEHSGKSMSLTDLGDVMMRAGYNDTDLMSAGYATRFDKLREFYGLAHDDGAMTLAVEPSRLGDSIFTFAQASLELVQLSKMPKERKRRAENRFRHQVSELINAVVPAGQLEANWHDEALDPERVYPIDFCIHTLAKDWYVFGVGSKDKCLHAAISCQKYRLDAKNFEGLAIYKDKARLKKKTTKPLDDVVSIEFPTIAEPSKIEQYIQQNILKSAG